MLCAGALWIVVQITKARFLQRSTHIAQMRVLWPAYIFDGILSLLFQYFYSIFSVFYEVKLVIVVLFIF